MVRRTSRSSLRLNAVVIERLCHDLPLQLDGHVPSLKGYLFRVRIFMFLFMTRRIVLVPKPLMTYGYPLPLGDRKVN